MAAAHGFCVLLGPDYAGKSSALFRLRQTAPQWRTVSVDDAYLAPEHALIGRLRREVPAVAGADATAQLDAWSPEFLATLLGTAVVHLRDEVARHTAHGPVVVDSYYYKILAKCRLAGVRENPMFAWWRSFPQPVRVLRLEVPPRTTWRRCGAGAALNSLEHYGEKPDWEGFRRYQSDLDKIMREETDGLPVTVVPAQDNPADTAAALQEALAHEFR
ncbi:hypothetical protein ACFQVC_39605 [Streptomyces monticola]|uniref:Thymidylate kinase n=1 Tax=Streptomyces monticola TaxID=2666263 RepID=A0ABW2JY20_9ACTN